MLVQQYVQQGRGYAATEQYKRWTTVDCTEVKCNKHKTKVQIEDIQLTAAQNQDTEVVHTQRAERNEEVYITPGLVNYCLRQEAKNTLLQMSHDENNRLAGVSDGSVRTVENKARGHGHYWNMMNDKIIAHHYYGA